MVFSFFAREMIFLHPFERCVRQEQPKSDLKRFWKKILLTHKWWGLKYSAIFTQNASLGDFHDKAFISLFCHLEINFSCQQEYSEPNLKNWFQFLEVSRKEKKLIPANYPLHGPCDMCVCFCVCERETLRVWHMCLCDCMCMWFCVCVYVYVVVWLCVLCEMCACVRRVWHMCIQINEEK